jgi:hypothetical protein
MTLDSGAYVVQDTENSRGIRPKIRCVLANEGSQEQAWQPVTSQPAGMIGVPDHLIAVIGLGVSSFRRCKAQRHCPALTFP